MATGMWTSVSGAAAQAQALDQVANNLANANTDGFKKDVTAFKEYLASAERDNQNPTVPHGPIKDKDLNPIYDKDQSHVMVNGSYTSFKQGPLKVTQAPLDLALEGPGLIEVASPSGIKYTRHATLKINNEGRLVTPDGYPVLTASPNAAPLGTQPLQPGMPAPGSMNDPQMASRYISLRDRNNISITEAGEIYAGEDLIGKISVAEFADTKTLQKAGLQYFENKDPVKNPPLAAAKTKIHQGMIEGSNVNPVEEMTNLIRANRMFEHDLKVMKTFGELMQREANDIGKL